MNDSAHTERRDKEGSHNDTFLYKAVHPNASHGWSLKCTQFVFFVRQEIKFQHVL